MKDKRWFGEDSRLEPEACPAEPTTGSKMETILKIDRRQRQPPRWDEEVAARIARESGVRRASVKRLGVNDSGTGCVEVIHWDECLL